MQAKEIPVTNAIRFLRENKGDFVPHFYKYKDKGGTRHTAEELNIEEHYVVKTLVMEDESGESFIVLMHGDFEVSAKELARSIGSKSVKPCDAQKAMRLTGYQFGGTSPFGTKNPLPVFVEKSIYDLEEIYINGGKQGFIIQIKPELILYLPDVREVNVATKK